jgi:hypothetical protein
METEMGRWMRRGRMMMTSKSVLGTGRGPSSPSTQVGTECCFFF